MQDFGVVGLAVMGKNIALNIENRGFSVSVFNRSPEKTSALLEESGDKNIKGTFSPEEFAASLKTPRKILLMVQAGEATDRTIESLIPYLDQGDILIDGGNTYYKDTNRREKALEEKGLRFLGVGVSGGEEGALKGPAIMPGGPKGAYEEVKPVLEAISAKVDEEPCCSYIGPGGSGHYVKMVHNGIEYGDMELISEVYFIMKHALKMTEEEMAEVFREWNDGELNSYLIDITADILRVKDDQTGKPLLDVILDAAGQKGTGKWTSKEALDLGVPATVITESVFMRFMSSLKEERVKASAIYEKPAHQTFSGDRSAWIEELRKALYLSKICSYAQGFAQLKAASDEHDWQINYGAAAMIFRGGCIIRAQFLQNIKDAFDREPELTNLLTEKYFSAIAKQYASSLRNVAAEAIKSGIPVPSMAAAVTYFDSYRSPVLPANMIQAQRDYFGAHTYRRTDREGVFHTDWIKESRKFAAEKF